MIKPKLKSSSKVVTLPEDAKPSLSNNLPSSFVEFQTVGWGPILKGWGKSIILFGILAIILGLAAYAGLASTIAYSVKIDNKFYAVARDTYVGDEIPKGEVVYASYDAELEDSIPAKFSQGAKSLVGLDPVEKPVVVRIIAGPTVKISVNSGNVTVNPGTDKQDIVEQPVEGLKSGASLLKDEYIVECEWGACEVGERFILPAGNVSGEIIKLGSR